MAKNLIMKARNALDIDRKVERVFKDLGNPEPLLDLEVVRELLKLDLAFYSAEDPGVLHEVVSKLTMASKQVLDRPSRILDAVRKWTICVPCIFLTENRYFSTRISPH